MHTNCHKKIAPKGFTLIEVMVSLSIFTVVVTISVGALVVLIDANARAQNTQSVLTNISFALDSITREIRTGNDFFCSTSVLGTNLPESDTGLTEAQRVSDCNGGLSFSFNEGGKSLTGDTANDSRRIGLRLANDSIERRLGDGDWQSITAPHVIVTTMRFATYGTTIGDNVTPVTSIYINGHAGVEADLQGHFEVQTTIVQQLLDI